MSTKPQAVNEPVRSYESGSDDRKNLQIKYDQMASEVVEIPLIIGGKEVKTGEQSQCVMPHDHQHVLGNFHMAGENEVSEAIESSMLAWNTWSKTSLIERTKIFRKAAELLQGPWRDTINAATMLNQSKNAFQAEICLLYTSPSPRDISGSRMPSSA